MATGDIGSVIETLITDATKGVQPSVAYRGDNICIVATRGVDNHGWVKSFSVSAAGDISDAIIDDLEFDDAGCNKPKLIHVTGDIFAVVYSDADDDGWIKTFSVDSDGEISNDTIGEREFDGLQGTDPEIVHVAGTTYAIAYNDTANDPHVVTVSISAAGAVAGLDTEGTVVGTASGSDPSICRARGAFFAVAYNGDENEHTIITIGITDAGVIDEEITGTKIFDDTSGTQFCVIGNGLGMVAIAYQYEYDGTGKLKTVVVNAEGGIGDVVETFALDAAWCIEPRIIGVSTDVYAIAYEGPDGDGFLKTIGIDGTGNIDAAVIDELEFQPDQGGDPSIVYVTGNIYAIAYVGANGLNEVGNVCSVDIETAALRRSMHMMGML